MRLGLAAPPSSVIFSGVPASPIPIILREQRCSSLTRCFGISSVRSECGVCALLCALSEDRCPLFTRISLLKIYAGFSPVREGYLDAR